MKSTFAVLVLALGLAAPAFAAHLPADVIPAAPAPVVHFELVVKNLSVATDFYTELFHWRIQAKIAMPGYGYIAAAPGGIAGGLRLEQKSASGTQGTVIYVKVDSLRLTLEHATFLGASVIVPPTLIDPQTGSFAMISDPDGNMIGLYSQELVPGPSFK